MLTSHHSTVNVTAPQDLSVLELHFLSASLPGQSHPQASLPCITIPGHGHSRGRYSVQIEIVGEYLALLLMHPRLEMDGQDNDAFYLVHWKTGQCYTVSRDIYCTRLVVYRMATACLY